VCGEGRSEDGEGAGRGYISKGRSGLSDFLWEELSVKRDSLMEGVTRTGGGKKLPLGNEVKLKFLLKGNSSGITRQYGRKKTKEVRDLVGLVEAPSKGDYVTQVLAVKQKEGEATSQDHSQGSPVAIFRDEGKEGRSRQNAF